MSDLHWATSIERLNSYVFRIKTPHGFGTGFLMTNRASGVCGVATAWHVVAHAHEWGEPIKVLHPVSEREILLRSEDRVIYSRTDRDSALILFQRGDLVLPEQDLDLVPEGNYLRPGLSLGWVGYPNVASETLCFFEGKVSAFVNQHDSYFVDGVAINGVSGGPAFRSAENYLAVVGVVSAYVANRATGEALPGLCVVQGVAPFHRFLASIRSIEDARMKVAATVEPTTVPPPEEPSSPEP